MYHFATDGVLDEDEQARVMLSTLYGDDDILEMRLIGESEQAVPAPPVCADAQLEAGCRARGEDGQERRRHGGGRGR